MNHTVAGAAGSPCVLVLRRAPRCPALRRSVRPPLWRAGAAAALLLATRPVHAQDGRRTPFVFAQVGHPAPPLAVLTWLNVPPGTPPGTPVTTFGDGHVYVLEFTADWCHACPGYYPIMDSLQQKFGSRGLRIRYVTALSWQRDESKSRDPADQQSKLEDVQEFIDQYHLHHPVGVFRTGHMFFWSGYWNLDSKGRLQQGVPKSVLIDGKGIVRAVDFVDDDGRDKEIAALLGAAQDATSRRP